MPMLPILPVIPGESLTSYFNRMAHFHGRTGVYQFLDIIELSRGAVMTPKEPDFARIRSLTGLSDVTLSRMTFRPSVGVCARSRERLFMPNSLTSTRRATARLACWRMGNWTARLQASAWAGSNGRSRASAPAVAMASV
ncbi:TniQ family protein [Gemmobacter lanyuensis]